MKELVQCFIAWLVAEPTANNASKILGALAQETLKRADSPDPEQREFDAVALVEVCRAGEELDYETAKKWFKDATIERHLMSRLQSIESFFRSQGHKQCLALKKRQSRGRHKTTWYLDAYDLPNFNPDSEYQEGIDPSKISYSVVKPPEIKLNLLGKLMLGRGEFITRSGRGVFWAGLMILSVLPVITAAFLIIAMGALKHDIQTNEVVLVLALTCMCAAYWYIVIRPWALLLDDRIVLGGNFFTALLEDPSQLDMAKDDKHRYIRLVRYAATCPVCAGNIELRYGSGENKRRIFGCCSEVPQEHVFTFDRVTKIGDRYIR